MAGGPVAGKMGAEPERDEGRAADSGRFSREPASPRLGEPGSPDPRPAEALDAAELLDRLERQAAEIGRLGAKTRSLERALSAERDARRKLIDTLDRERKAAAGLTARAKRDRAASAASEAELQRLRRAADATEEQVQLTWAQLASAERRLAWHQRRLWRKLLRRPPAQHPGAVSSP